MLSGGTVFVAVREALVFLLSGGTVFVVLSRHVFVVLSRHVFVVLSRHYFCCCQEALFLFLSGGGVARRHRSTQSQFSGGRIDPLQQRACAADALKVGAGRTA